MSSRISSLSASESEKLSQLFARPDRVEIHGSDRDWIAGVLSSVMTSARMSFGFFKSLVGPRLRALEFKAIDCRQDLASSWRYAAKGNNGEGQSDCMVELEMPIDSDMLSLAQAGGVPADLARDFCSTRESAYFAHRAEVIARQSDKQEQVNSGLGHAADSPTLLASERFADGCALLALLAQGRADEQQAKDIIAWRQSVSGDAGFLMHLMQEAGNGQLGVDAVHSHVLSSMQDFAKAQRQHRRLNGEDLHDALMAAGRKLREATAPAAAIPAKPDSSTRTE
ncbi:MAG: hypothetical protein EPN79_11415 [Burkholderiaceae bacterium]|nr:MAG: hypothetical protein EPN79_11415 [Burkholderiaceae bacterium]TBR76706.1 MAG: hypothetical protein EPN64_05650 [Burkholderiaceae bacterium]